jgi:hypothetical protein
VLIDEPRWWFRGRRWSHLVSDTTLHELHAFAVAAGIPRRGFQGDHYDVPEEMRDELIAAGAQLVESRELVRRLRAGGLRLSPAERRAGAGSPAFGLADEVARAFGAGGADDVPLDQVDAMEVGDVAGLEPSIDVAGTGGAAGPD